MHLVGREAGGDKLAKFHHQRRAHLGLLMADHDFRRRERKAAKDVERMGRRAFIRKSRVYSFDNRFVYAVGVLGRKCCSADGISSPPFEFGQ